MGAVIEINNKDVNKSTVNETPEEILGMVSIN